MKSFVTRSISAILAVSILFGLFHFLGNDGLKIIVLFAVIVGSFELVRILFKPEDSRLNRFTFYIFINLIFVLSVLFPSYSGTILSIFSIAFCLVSILTQKKFEGLQALTSFQAKTVLGFMYCGLLPAFAVGIIDLNHGTIWFLTLLAVVFAGDIGAYITGMLIGKRKLMPLISPKKTIEGSMGGLVASSMIGMSISNFFLPHVPLFFMLVLSLITAVAGQFGDLFESQLKRVADVKDSGRIMPGHGGVLDRIDGVLFGCPIIYIGATILEALFKI